MTRIYLALFVAWLPMAAFAAATIQEADQAFRQGQYSAALDKVNGFLAANGKDAQGRFLKGLILTELNRYADAIKVFSTLTDDYPELPEPYNNLAVLYAAQGQYDQAKQSLEMAIRTHPSYATAHENLGDIYAKMASQSYDKALQLDRTNTSALTKLSLIKELFNPASRMNAPAVTKTADKPAAKGDKPTAVATKVADKTEPALAEQSAQPVAPAVVSVAAPPNAPAATRFDTPAKLVKAWAEAWSRQDVAAYVAFYSPDFAPQGMDHETWAAQRKERIERAKKLQIEISHLRAQVKGDSAKVSFRQRYSSERFSSNDKKTLQLKKIDGSWLITEER